MIFDATSKRTYWLVFKNGQYWYTSFLKRGFGHVFVITNDGKRWLQLDPVASRLVPCVFDCTIDAPNVLKKIKGYKILKIVLNEQYTKRSILRPFFIISCVEIVKYIVGLRLFCFTPYGLYRRLTGAKKPAGVDSVQVII